MIVWSTTTTEEPLAVETCGQQSINQSISDNVAATDVFVGGLASNLKSGNWQKTFSGVHMP